MSGSTENEELYRGMLSKCGGKVKTWNKRAMSLKTDYCLYYYKDGSKKHQGLISLRDPKFAVRKGEKSDCSWPKAVDMNNTLVVVTTPRTYYMFADSAEEAREWREQLAMAHVRMIEGLTLQRKAKAHTAPTVGADQPRGDGNEDVASSVPKRFQKNNRNKVTKRFQGDEGSSDHDGEGEGIELDENKEDTAARSSSTSVPGEGKSEDSSGRSASHSGAPKRYKKKDRHMPTPRFQQEEGEEEEGEEKEGEDGLLMAMSMEDLRESSLAKSGDKMVTETTYEDVTIISTTENEEVPGSATPSNPARKEQHPKAVSAPGPTTLIYDEIPGEVKGEVLYEDLEIKGTTAGKSPSLPVASVHPSPKPVSKNAHMTPVSKLTIPVEESLYNKNATPTSLPDAVYDLIGYNPEQDVPPARPDEPAVTTSVQQCHPEEILYDVVKMEPFVENRAHSLLDTSIETSSPATANNSVLTDSPPPLPQRNPSMVELNAPPLPSREPLKPTPGSQSSKMPKHDNMLSEKDADLSQDRISPSPMLSSDCLVSSIPNSAPLASLVLSSDDAVDSSVPMDAPSRTPLVTPNLNHPVSAPQSPAPPRSPRSPAPPRSSPSPAPPRSSPSPAPPRSSPSPAPPRSPQPRAMDSTMSTAGSATVGEVVDASISQQPPSPAPVQSSFQLEPPESVPEHLHKAETATKMDDRPNMDPSHEVQRHEETSPQMGEVSRGPICTDPEEPLSPQRPSLERAGHSNQGSPQHVELKDLNLFLRQQKKFAERDTTLVAEREINIQALKTVLNDTSLTSDKKAAFGELLREIEQQKQLASEERYKWERERMKFESERQKFQEEKRQFQEEMERLKANAQK
ncbi:hypothetical protein EMCRGX_G025386 [Ephydatia muelleri]